MTVLVISQQEIGLFFIPLSGEYQATHIVIYALSSPKCHRTFGDKLTIY